MLGLHYFVEYVAHCVSLLSSNTQRLVYAMNWFNFSSA
jgi:hypothetical protein